MMSLMDELSEYKGMLLGYELARGYYRAVYVCVTRPECVVKVELQERKFCNIREWDAWGRVRGTDHERWFAPCEWISPGGTIMLMRRTMPQGEYPDKVPYYFSDIKASNFGFIGKNLVCHDYAGHLMMEYGLTKRMRKATWKEMG